MLWGYPDVLEKYFDVNQIYDLDKTNPQMDYLTFDGGGVAWK